MRQWWAKAVQGERQVGFVTGEAGIGKTTLVAAFIARVGGEGALGIGHGQCIEQYGVGDAYLPVLEALGRLCRGPAGQRVIALLGQYAPSWLVQMPTLLGAADLDALQRRGLGATHERMLRELAEALEALTAERPLDPGAGRPAVERLCHPGVARLCGPASGEGRPARHWDLSADGRARARASRACGHAGTPAAWAM